jgi:hypothetical protein
MESTLNIVCLRLGALIDRQIFVQQQYEAFQNSQNLDFVNYTEMLIRMKVYTLECLEKVFINVPRGAVC